LIASEEPVIIGEAPPSTWEHPYARRMFADGRTDYHGPQRLKLSSAATKVKRAGKSLKNAHTEPPSTQGLIVGASSATTAKQVEDVVPPRPTPPPARPFHVVIKPKGVTAPPPPPPTAPTRPSKVVSRATQDPKAGPQEVLEINSASDEQEVMMDASETEYEDDAGANKRKRKAKSTSRSSKKRIPSDEGIKRKETKGKGKKPLKTSDPSPLKGGPLSPLTVGSSSDERNEG